MTHTLPETGFVRLPQIIGDPLANPPIPPIIPVSKTSWYEGVKSGRFPQPIRLGRRSKGWRVEDIRALVQADADLSSGKSSQSGKKPLPEDGAA